MLFRSPEKDSVIFKDKWGVKLKVSKGNILNFSGVTDADTNYIYAYRGDEKIGKLSVNTYKKKSYKVVLVRVNKATLPDINELEKYLGKVYRQSVDSIEIDTAYFYSLNYQVFRMAEVLGIQFTTTIKNVFSVPTTKI